MGDQTAGRSKLASPKNFKEFWIFYVGEHINPLTRFLHVSGTTLALILLLATFLSKAWIGLLMAPILAYAIAWISHFVIEKNKPATFRYPLWSLMADFVMLYKSFNNTMEAEVAKVKKLKGLSSFLFAFLASCFFQSSASAQCDENFNKMREQAKERYENFYERQRKEEEWNKEKDKGIAELKKRREQQNAELEKARLERVELRKKEFDAIAPLEAEYLAEQKKNKAKELEIERQYAQCLEKTRSYEKKQYPLSSKEEYGLE